MNKLTLVFLAILLVAGCSYGGSRPAGNPGDSRPETRGGGVGVLMYHHIDEQEGPATISPERFRSHLDMLEREGFRVIPMSDLIAFLENRKNLPPRAVVITFDDGYRSFYTYAFPELRKRGLTATNFLVVGKVGKKGDFIPTLTWDEVREMRDAGMEFGAHSFNSHDYAETGRPGQRRPLLAGPVFIPHWGRVETDSEFRQRVKTDLAQARDVFRQELGYDPEIFAFPFGWASPVACELAQEAGFKYIFTIEPGRVTAGTPPSELPRINAGAGGLSAEELLVKLKQYGCAS